MPSTATSDLSVDSSSSRRTTEKPDRTEDVTLTVSVSPSSPAPPPNQHPSPPFARSHHVRSRSLAEIPGAPVTRAHLSPGLDSRGRYIFVNGHDHGSSLSDASAKRYVPLHVVAEENVQAKMASMSLSKPSSDHHHHHPAVTTRSSSASQAELRPSSPFSRFSRRRPSSPLHFHVTANNGNNHYPRSPSPAHPSPLMLNTKYNETYPGGSSSSSSSLPSTPSSLRSRSPSISSLETIPDIPDAEAAATEADRVAAMKAATEKANAGGDDNYANRRRGASDASTPSGAFTHTRVGSGAYNYRADRRKRWSVCGAERRQDLDLETIWED